MQILRSYLVNPYKKSNRIALALTLAIISLFIYLPGIDMPFVTTGEPREALVAQGMVIHNDLLQSNRYENDLATKPPMLHWSIVAFSKLIGEVNETSSRLPSVVAATVTAVAWALLLLPIVGPQRSALFFIVLSTSLEWYRNAAHSRVDMLLACFVSLAIAALYRWSRTDNSKYLLTATLLMAGSALTKGPVGIALPILIAAAALGLRRELNRRMCIQLALASAAAAIPLAAWYLTKSLSGEGSVLGIALNENLNRLTGNMSNGDDPHEHGVLYLFGTFFTGTLPWSLLAIPALVFYAINRRRLLKDEPTQALVHWCTSAVAVCLLLFSIPASKRGVYLLPIYPAAATLAALALHELAKEKLALTRGAAAATAAFLGFVWTVLALLRLSIFDLTSFASSPKSQAALAFYSHAFDLSEAGPKLLLQLLPVAASALCLYAIYKRGSSALHAFGMVFAFYLVFIKLDLIKPAAIELSPKSFIAMEIRDHSPLELSLANSRMYGEAFYIRQLNPKLKVSEYSGGSNYVLLWARDRGLIPEPRYLHESNKAIDKPDRRLEFAIVN
ncbi:MAG: glycosyltransferase family 39 protein [Bdellovibrionales bacterium]|nr:glycosyltransferase family 39 protein [Bdellovibrionales bacterium]